jgi:sugar lactone lactonase YvrE
MTIAPHSGIIDFGTFTPPTDSQDGIQGEVPAPLIAEVAYVLSATGWVPMSGGGSGTVTSVSGTGTVSGLSLSGTVTTSGSLTLGGTLAVLPSNFASQTANTVLAAPNGSAGTPTFRAIVAADVPTLNQNTTGTASNVTGIVAVANGGTGANIAGTARTNLSAAASGANTDITSIALTTGTISTAPASNNDIANKQYVDEVAEGLRAKPSVRAATTTNLAAVYDNGASGVGATLTADTNRVFTTLDGVTGWAITTPPQGVLVKNQTNPAYNGRYNLTSLGEVGVSPWVLTRCSLCDTANEIPGSYTFVTGGTVNGGTGWVQTVVDPATFVVGTDAIIVVQFSGAGTYSAGTGLTLTGTVFSLTAPVTVALGGTGATDAATALANLGAYPASNPNGYTSNTGTVTSVSGTGTVNGITLTGSVTTSGSLTLGGTLSGVDLTSQVTGTLPVANGGTGAATLTANNVLLGNGTSAVQAVAPSTAGNVLTSDGTTWVSSPSAAAAIVAYPQNIQSANYTLVLSDQGKQIFHPASDNSVRVYTIPANSSVAFPIGTVVLFTVENNGATVDVAITSDTLVFGDGTTGTVAVYPNNTLMAIKVTATKWMANYLYQTGNANLAGAIAVAHATSPYVTAYPWNSTTGFGTKYANPSPLPASTSNGVAFNPAGISVAVAHSSSPYVTAYSWITATGFGTKYSNPATLPASTGNGVAFTANGDAIAVAHSTSPYVTAYPWSNTTGFGTKYTNPATLPTGTGNGVAFNPAGTSIAIAHSTTPFVAAYPWNSTTGFGTKYADPATLPASTGNGVAFNPLGDTIAVVHAGTPFVTAYPWNSTTGFGTKYANPATLPVSTSNGVAFSPAGDAIAVAHSGSPYVTAYPWSVSGFGTKYADPATLPAGTGNGVAFSPAGDAIAVAHSTTPFVTAYPWGGITGFGTKYADPATLPTGTGNSTSFHPFV